MDIANRYLDLARRGREAFLQGAAPAALFRRRSQPLRSPTRPQATRHFDDFLSGDNAETTTIGSPERGLASGPGGDVEIYPLVKKPGAAFPDMITVGRTANNDVVLADVTVSRFHAFFRERDGAWIVCDAGSKNGTRVDQARLEARKEVPVQAGSRVRVGDVEAAFYPAEDLYDLLCRHAQGR